MRDAYNALPSVYKFFWMIYRLSPMRTVVIIAVFMVQGLLPALRLRTGGDFIRQVNFPPETEWRVMHTVACEFQGFRAFADG